MRYLTTLKLDQVAKRNPSWKTFELANKLKLTIAS